MLKFTVVLKRPAHVSTNFAIGEDERDTDIYIAYVEAADTEQALAEARKQVSDADKRDWNKSDTIEKFYEHGKWVKLKYNPDWVNDYKMLVILEGHPKTKAFGCVTGWNK